MIVKLMRNANEIICRDFTLIDKISSIRKSCKLYAGYNEDSGWFKDSDICYLDRRDLYLEHCRVTNKIAEENEQFPFYVLFCTTNDGKELKIVSDMVIYILNDEGKTIESIYPRSEN